MTRYTNTRAGELIAATPRAVYLITIERAGLSALSFATGTLRWRDVVARVLDRSTSAAGFPIGANLGNVTNDDRTAVLSYLAGTNPGRATVADLAATVDAASPYASVIAVERIPPVSGNATGGIGALENRQAAEAERARQEAAERTLTARVAGALRTSAGTVQLIAAAVIVAGLVYLLPRGNAK